jgi:hypothetical protein
MQTNTIYTMLKIREMNNRQTRVLQHYSGLYLAKKRYEQTIVYNSYERLRKERIDKIKNLFYE